MDAFHQAREAALLQLRRGGTVEARAQAASALCRLADAHPELAGQLVESLPSLLSAPEPEVRRAGAALAAHTLEPAEAQEVLTRCLADSEASVRLEAAGRLADQGRPEARGVLAAALEDPSFRVRFEAARGMAAIGHRAGRAVLLEGLERPDLRFRAIGALAELGDASVAPALKMLVGRFFVPAFDRTQAAGALVKLGDPSGGSYLLARTRRRWSADRSLALELCGEVKVAGAFDRLAEVVSNPKDVCRGAAARGLGRLGDPRAGALLQTLLDDPALAEDVRLDAAEGLCRLGTSDARGCVERTARSWPAGEGRQELETMLEETT